MRWLIYLGLFVIFLVIGFVGWNWLGNNATSSNLISLVGTLASLYGIIVTFAEVIITQRTTKQTQNAVKKHIMQYGREVTIARIAESISMAESISVYVETGKLAEALFRIKDFCKNLRDVKRNELFNNPSIQVTQQLKRTIQSAELDAKTLTRAYYDKGDYNTSKLINNMSDAQKFLDELNEFILNQK